jgi:uncharacterized membrane protein
MNLRFYVICTVVILALGVPALLTLGVPFLADSNTTATVHGATYAWDTLEPLNDTLININSNPPQSIVAKNGMYSFELAPGNYIITASYYQNNTLLYSKKATLKIEDEGNYVFDLLLHPASENQVAEEIEDGTNTLNSMNSIEQTRDGYSTLSYLPVALMLFLIFGGGYKLFSRNRKIEENRPQEGKFSVSALLVKVFGKSTGYGVSSEFASSGKTVSITQPVMEFDGNSETETAALKKLPLSNDLREVLDVIRGHKGRITQKNLRSRLDYSEVKVSLLLSELEKRGLIKKFKNGRENIVTLIDAE